MRQRARSHEYDLTARLTGRSGQVVPASTVRMLADWLSKALRRFLYLKELGLPVGFPRFKTPSRWHSIQWRQYGRAEHARDNHLDPGGKHLYVAAKLGK